VPDLANFHLYGTVKSFLFVVRQVVVSNTRQILVICLVDFRIAVYLYFLYSFLLPWFLIRNSTHMDPLPSLMVSPGHAIQGGRFKIRVELVANQMRGFGQFWQVRDAKNTRTVRELAATTAVPDLEARNVRLDLFVGVMIKKAYPWSTVVLPDIKCGDLSFDLARVIHFPYTHR